MTSGPSHKMGRKLVQIPIEKLELWREANVRKSGASVNIEDLAGNIKQNGIRVPLLVKPQGAKYGVFSGQRRLIACRIAKETSIPCFVFPTIGLHDAMVLSLSENLYREAMTAEDKSRAAGALVKQLGSLTKVAKAMGVSYPTVRKYLTYSVTQKSLRLSELRAQPFLITRYIARHG